MHQLVQVLGSLLILSAFVAAQRGALSMKSRSYLLLNFAGSAVLTVLAVHEQQWGFFLLEFCWAVVSGWSLIRVPFTVWPRPRRPSDRATRCGSRPCADPSPRTPTAWSRARSRQAGPW